MDFMPQPDEAKKFGVKWVKWHIMKYPHIFMICLPVPFAIYKASEVIYRCNRDLKNGKYAPNVVMNNYTICRPSDYLAKITPTRYQN